MKIEKVNDHQIRWILTKADMADRELKISELAYGTEKAKNLFRDMMQQAAQKFGFEADDIPLMIEAIPLNADCIVLIITKVEDPEELDTRFSKFAPSAEEDEDGIDPDDSSTRASKSADSSAAPAAAKEKKPTPDIAIGSARIFSFSSMHDLIRLAHVACSFYDGKNSLYKNTKSGKYSLVISEENISAEAFNRICNVVSEYGRLERSAIGSEAYFKEHYDLISDGKALQTLVRIQQRFSVENVHIQMMSALCCVTIQ